jgi:hypothetical protein
MNQKQDQLDATDSGLFHQLYLNMFRAFLCPSSGEQTAYYCIWFSTLAIAGCSLGVYEVSCVHCGEEVSRAISSPQCTQPTPYSPRPQPATASAENHTQ